MLVFVVIVLLIRNFPGSYQVGGNVGLYVNANPSTIEPGGTSTLEVELKNVNSKDEITATVKGQTFDDDITFSEGDSKTYASQSIKIGPEGVKRITVKVKSKASALQGKYPIDVTATAQGGDKSAQQRVFLTVEKSS